MPMSVLPAGPGMSWRRSRFFASSSGPAMSAPIAELETSCLPQASLQARCEWVRVRSPQRNRGTIPGEPGLLTSVDPTAPPDQIPSLRSLQHHPGPQSHSATLMVKQPSRIKALVVGRLNEPVQDRFPDFRYEAARRPSLKLVVRSSAASFRLLFRSALLSFFGVLFFFEATIPFQVLLL